VKVLKYPNVSPGHTQSELEHRVEQLVLIAKALSNEIETLQAELSRDRMSSQPKQIALDSDGIDFYEEVKRYEIELIKSALNRCGGNQTRAARLLRMKSTTLNAKMKHYGLNPVRSIMVQHPNP
jgi:DNA-binding NtrC family response regulator